MRRPWTERNAQKIRIPWSSLRGKELRKRASSTGGGKWSGLRRGNYEGTKKRSSSRGLGKLSAPFSTGEAGNTDRLRDDREGPLDQQKKKKAGAGPGSV